jgi:hypothetical protein
MCDITKINAPTLMRLFAPSVAFGLRASGGIVVCVQFGVIEM